MSFFWKNKHVFKKTIFGFFFVCLMLIPGITITHTGFGFDSYYTSTGIAYAQTTDTNGFLLWQKGLDLFINTLGTIIIAVPSAFAWFGGELLDISIKFSVLEMSANINTTLFGTSIDAMWKLIRDICNLIFIFGFIFTGIRTIIDPENAETKRFVSRIIIGALLINFSLFFVKAVIDFSNFLAFQIYSAMMDPGGSISQTIANLLGIVTIYNVVDGNVLAKLSAGGKGFWFYVLAAIFLFITAFVFVVAAIMFIIRFVALILIMVASPILFAATVFPQTAHYASDLWGKLINYSFFAPAYLLLIFISITLLQGLSPSLNTSGISAALTQTGVTGSFGVFLNFFIVIFFMIASLSIANKMGIKGGDFAIKLAGGATYGLAARLNRVTLGRYANYLSEKDSWKDAASKRGAKGFIMRQALKGSRVVADSSLDLRNTETLGFGKALGAGGGRKGGYKTVLGDVKKKEEEFAKSLGEVDDTDVDVRARKADVEQARRNLRKEEEALRQKLKPLRKEREGVSAQLAVETDENKKAKLKNDLKKIDDKIDSEKEKVEHTKHEIHEAEVRYAQEKQRRILGSTYSQPKNPEDTAKMKKAEEDIKKASDNIQHAWQEYGTLIKEDDKKKERERIKGLMGELKKERDKHNEFLRKNVDRGYAGVLENASWYTTWPLGRLIHMEEAAGKAIRKARVDGHPKEDHKGGHGDHGDHGAKHDDHSGGHATGHEEDHDDDHSDNHGKKSSIIVESGHSNSRGVTKYPAAGGHDHGHDH